MARAIELEPRVGVERATQDPPVAFLDTDVVLGYLHGDPTAVQLFCAESDGRVRFAINPIVLGNSSSPRMRQLNLSWTGSSTV
jgi:hypothetical protein